MSVFRGNNYLIDYENVSYVYSMGGQELTIGVFGGFQITLHDSRQVELFKKEYITYLADKYPREDFSKNSFPETKKPKKSKVTPSQEASEERMEKACLEVELDFDESLMAL